MQKKKREKKQNHIEDIVSLWRPEDLRVEKTSMSSEQFLAYRDCLHFHGPHYFSLVSVKILTKNTPSRFFFTQNW